MLGVLVPLPAKFGCFRDAVRRLVGKQNNDTSENARSCGAFFSAVGREGREGRHKHDLHPSRASSLLSAIHVIVVHFHGGLVRLACRLGTSNLVLRTEVIGTRMGETTHPAFRPCMHAKHERRAIQTGWWGHVDQTSSHEEL